MAPTPLDLPAQTDLNPARQLPAQGSSIRLRTAVVVEAPPASSPTVTRWQAPAWYTLTVLVCMAATYWILDLGASDFSVPYTYGSGDSWMIQMWVKTTADEGWYLHNRRLGAPATMHMHDYPLSESLHLGIMKGMSMLGCGYGAAINLYYLLAFPLTSLTSLLVLRRFQIGYGPAAVVSVLYSFLPFRLIRSQHHLFLTTYYMVPLIVLVLLWLYEGQLFWVPRSDQPERLRFDAWSGRSLATIAIALLTACSGVYFGFFMCFFALVASVAAAWERRSSGPLKAGGLVIALVMFGVLCNGAPTLLYQYRYGPNPDVPHREAREAELYGLKITELLLPVIDHRLPALAELKQRYQLAPLVTENDWATLGFVGSIGFLVLLARLLFRRSSDAISRPLEALTTLNIAGVLLATIGGLGSLFALAFPAVRAYNRISLFIAFFSLFMAAWLLDRLGKRIPSFPGKRVLGFGALALLLAAGVADQTCAGMAPNHEQAALCFAQDRDFIEQIEATMPAGAMIFQLPYTPFPEKGGYQHFRGYLHSKTLRWSYGAMLGRQPDDWQHRAAALPTELLLVELRHIGFRGLYVDRTGLPQHAEQLEAELHFLLDEQPIESANGELAFYRLPEPDAAPAGRGEE